jgi:hypothetical protein
VFKKRFLPQPRSVRKGSQRFFFSSKEKKLTILNQSWQEAEFRITLFQFIIICTAPFLIKKVLHNSIPTSVISDATSVTGHLTLLNIVQLLIDQNQKCTPFGVLF